MNHITDVTDVRSHAKAFNIIDKAIKKTSFMDKDTEDEEEGAPKDKRIKFQDSEIDALKQYFKHERCSLEEASGFLSIHPHKKNSEKHTG